MISLPRFTLRALALGLLVYLAIVFAFEAGTHPLLVLVVAITGYSASCVLAWGWLNGIEEGQQ